MKEIPALEKEYGYILTYTGKRFYPDFPESLEADIIDIAHALSNVCRYNGHLKSFYCVTPDTKVLTYDLSWVPVGDIKTGQLLWGFDEYSKGHRDNRKWQPSAAIVHGLIEREVLEIKLADGTILKCSEEHPLLCSFKAAGNQRWETALSILDRYLKGGTTYLPKMLPTWNKNETWEAGWLAGMFDGEGCLSSTASRSVNLNISQNEGITLQQIEASLNKLNIKFRKSNAGQYKCKALSILGGLSEQLSLLGSIRPNRLLQKMQTRLAGREFKRTGELLPVVSVKRLGVLPVVALETTTHTYITEGFGSHNSVAQHSVLVSRYVQNMWPELGMAALLHDASEAYLPDMPSPIKANLPDFIALEHKVHEQIFKQFKLKWPYPALIKEIDKRIRVDEMKYMQEWGEEIDGKEGLGILITPWGPSIAEELFLEEYAILTNDIPLYKTK